MINDKSQGTVARHLSFCGIFDDHFTANLLMSVITVMSLALQFASITKFLSMAISRKQIFHKVR